MERQKEVEEILLKENVDLLFKETEDGKIGHNQLKMIANKMCGPVHGVFEAEQRKQTKLSLTLLYMLDKWYMEELYDPQVDGITKLVNILKH